MGLNCDPVHGHSADKIIGQPRAYRVEVQIPDLKMLLFGNLDQLMGIYREQITLQTQQSATANYWTDRTKDILMTQHDLSKLYKDRWLWIRRCTPILKQPTKKSQNRTQLKDVYP